MYNLNKILFLTKTSQYNYEQKVDIILSPELYWVRVFEIPVTNKKDIISVIPNFFEDFLDIENYKFYFISLEDNKKLCFAYDEDLILQTIKNANITLNQVSNIFFAQNEFKGIDSFKFDNNYFIYQDDILLKVPKELIATNEIINYDMDKVNLSKNKIYINTTNKYIDNKSIYIFSFIFIIIGLINFGKSGIVNSKIDTIISNQQDIKKEYQMLSTMLQTKSIIKSLEKKEQKQIILRQRLKKDFDLKKQSIQRISFKNGKVKYE
jgi:hypothetical protein